ncbi:MAG TPA: hypothetical protein VE442_16370 [Jatrophihabitans sp.]|nr:hypothetical protein [Jatrophihabitans sp.]
MTEHDPDDDPTFVLSKVLDEPAALDDTADASLVELPQAAPAALPPPAVGTIVPSASNEHVTCPECGTVATVSLARRDAADFCHSCDYPLFWTPSAVLLDRSGLGDASLRRLPGTVGRVAIASVTCPYCNEPNAVAAVDCVRCDQPLHPVRFELPPEPVYVPPPEPAPEPEPQRNLWWLWVLIAVTAATVALVALYATDVI